MFLVTPWMTPSAGPSKAKPEGARTGGPRSRRLARDGLSVGLRSEGSAQGLEAQLRAGAQDVRPGSGAKQEA